MADYKTYLAASVLNEGKIVSYRLLSRQLKVHCNIAKRMLYDFHSQQNARKGSSVHACYLVHGIPNIVKDSTTNGHAATDGDDTPMQSSPFQSSSQMPQQDQEEQGIPVRSINLVREQDLEDLKSTYDQIESIHIYSIGPSSVQNLEGLSDCNRTITKQFITEDPLVCGKQYGVIQNSNVKRRTGRRPPGVMPAIPGSKPVGRPSTPKVQAPNNSGVITAKPELSNSKANPPDTSTTNDKPLNKPPPKVRREASDIFRSFSKSKTKPNLKAEDTSTSLESAAVSNAEYSQGKPAVQEDEPMKDASEDEQEEDFITTSKTDPPSGKSKTARAEELRKMMDEEEDEEMRDAEAPAPADEPAPQDDSEPIDRPKVPSAETSPEPAVTTSGGRRRGRRKVMRKKTIKDEEGYLVTKDEPAWESFSEDEPPPTKERTPFSTGGSSKTTKQATKPGQGNIMTFFGKK